MNMNIWQFASDSPWLAFFLACLLCSATTLPFKLCNRIIRHLNIRKHGWPPAHLDADGDWKPKEKDDKK